MEEATELFNALPSWLREPDPLLYVYGTNWIVLDFETTNKQKGTALDYDNHIVLASWMTADGTVRSVRGSEYEQNELIDAVKSADFIVAHNAKFELGWLTRCGLDTPVLVYDTMLAEYVIGGNRWRYSDLSLSACASRYKLGHKSTVVSALIKSGVPVETIPAAWLQKYCEQDVALTAALFRAQLPFLADDERLLCTTYTRCLTAYVLSQIEFEGLTLDADAVEARLAEEEAAHSAAEEKLIRITGGINLASPKQLGEFLYDTLAFAIPKPASKRDEGKRKTDEATLARLVPKTPEQREFLELFRQHRSGHNVLTKYLRKFSSLVRAGKKVYAVFNQTNTFTHRLSSTGLESKIQLQNLQRALKPLFRASRDGWLIGEADGAQLEFRVAAHLGRDQRAIQDIADGKDVHNATASILGTDRQSAKSETFKPLYGGRRGTPAQERYYEYFRETYAGIASAQQGWINEVLATGKLETTCLDFYWPDTTMERSGYVKNSTAICNYPVQSLATADIIPIALVYLWHMMREAGMQAVIVNTVHDSVVVELPPEEVELFTNLARHCFINVVYWYLDCMYDVQFCAPLGVGVAFGSRWGNEEAKKSEKKYNAEESLWKHDRE